MRGRRKVLMGLAGASAAFAAAPSWAQSAFSMLPIVPQNHLESDFVAAFQSEAMRPVFRARLLDSQVSLALASAEADAAPLQVPLANGGHAGLIFTSPQRLESVLGASAPRVNLTGREALTRLRGGNVAINYRLIPMLTLEAEDVSRFLLIPGQSAPAHPSVSPDAPAAPDAPNLSEPAPHINIPGLSGPAQ